MHAGSDALQSPADVNGRMPSIHTACPQPPDGPKFLYAARILFDPLVMESRIAVFSGNSKSAVLLWGD